MDKIKKENIIGILSKSFSKDDHAKFYFVKGLKEYSNSIIIRTKKTSDNERILVAKNRLQKELKDQTIEILNWIDSVGGLIPRKNIYKIPFFDTEDIKEQNPWRVCPIGEHWVRRHDRQKKHLEDVDGHCRKNRSKKDLLMGDEIELISNHQLFKNSKQKSTVANIGFPANCNEYDELIAGWTAYWNNIFKIDPPLHPNYVKALIITESSFNAKAFNPNNSKRNGPARGLMQITESTQRQLGGAEKELKDHFVIIEGDEIYDPNINICAGVRWLFRKREVAKYRLKREPTWEEVLMEYKGLTTSKTQETQKIRIQLKKYLNELGVN